MTKIMAVTLVPVLAFLSIVGYQETPRPSQDAKSVAIDATHANTTQSVKDLQRQRTELQMRASRDYERELIKERRAKAKARAEARAERKAARQAERQQARQAEREAEAEAATSTPAQNTAPVSGNRAIGQSMAADRGWTGDQWSCLEALWTRESGWNHQAYNSSSGAYGIPQALPGSKMATAGSDWQTNPATQIKWGLNYIGARYGTPCGAWNHSESYGWY